MIVNFKFSIEMIDTHVHSIGLVQFFGNKLPGLSPQIEFFEDLKIHINPFTPKTAMFIPLIVHYYFCFTV